MHIRTASLKSLIKNFWGPFSATLPWGKKPQPKTKNFYAFIIGFGLVETRIYTVITLDAIWYSQFTPYAKKPAEILSCQTKRICYISISCIIQRTRPSNISTYLCMRHNLFISNWYLVNKNSIWLNYSFEKETLARVWRKKIAFIFSQIWP